MKELAEVKVGTASVDLWSDDTQMVLLTKRTSPTVVLQDSIWRVLVPTLILCSVGLFCMGSTAEDAWEVESLCYVGK